MYYKKNLVLIIIVVSMFFYNASILWSQILDRSIAIVSLYKTENISSKKIDMQYDLLRKQAASLTGKEETSLTKKDVLEAAINDVLITQEAVSKGVTVGAKQIDDIIKFQKEAYGVPISDEDFQSLMIKQTGLSWSEYREQIRRRLLQEQYLASKYQDQLREIKRPTEKEIQKTYDEYATMFINPSMIRTEHLFWDFRGVEATEKQALKKDAERVDSIINKSTNVFDKELKKSLENTKIEGGDLGYIIRDDQTKKVLGEDFLDQAFALSDNEVSNVITSKSGYHIIKVTDKRPAKLLELNDPILPGEKVTVRERLISTIQNQYRQQKFAELLQVEVDELRKKASIRIIDNQYK